MNAGTYTLRYAKIPEDGDHLGASPTPTFVAPHPVANDDEPADDLTFKAGREAEREDERHEPSGADEPGGHVRAEGVPRRRHATGWATRCFFVKLKGASGDVPLGLVVKGRTEHE